MTVGGETTYDSLRYERDAEYREWVDKMLKLVEEWTVEASSGGQEIDG